MAITSTYPIIQPKAGDLIVGTQTYTALDPVLDNPTRNFTIQSIIDLAEVDGISLSTVGTSGVSTLTAGVLNIPNYAADPSIVNTTGNQTIGGAKTFTTNISAPNVGGNNTGDQSLSISGQVITISGTDSTVTLPSSSGVTLDTTQTITGVKTFTNVVTITNRLSLSDSANNSFIGNNSGLSNTTGATNVGLGNSALYSNTTGSTNIGIGSSALYSNTTGGSNVGIGLSALYANTTGTFNIALGQGTLAANIGGNLNIALGIGGLRSNTTGGDNISLGYDTLGNTTTGSYNVGLGYKSGLLIADGSANTLCSSSIFIGKEARANGNNQTNQIVIGSGAVGNGSNMVTLGNDNIVRTYLKGDIILQGGGIFNAYLQTSTTGTIMIGNPAMGVTTSLNVTGDITMQSSTAAINLTSATAAIYMTSPDGTTYKVQMANGGTFNITQV